MKKVLIISNLSTLFLLSYYAVVKGLDILIGIALLVSILSNVLNTICEIRYGKRKIKSRA